MLTPLEGESLQPSNLSAGATNYLNVFFQAQWDGLGWLQPQKVIHLMQGLLEG